MKTKIMSLLLAAVLVASLVACAGGGDTGPAWQEQYDLGVRYLSEGNYEEAIIAFTAAIEIDPKRADAYTGRGQAYLLRNGEGDLDAAAADFQKTLELDDSSVDALLGLADVYAAQGDMEGAMDLLRGSPLADDPRVQEKLAELERAWADDLLGQAEDQARSGDTDQARQLLDQVLDAGVTDQETLDRVERLEEVLEWAASGRTVVYVDDGEELMDAIENYHSAVSIVLGPWEYYIPSELSISEAEDLILQGTAGSQILCQSGWDPVIDVYNSRQIVFRGLTIGHEIPIQEGGCTSGVLNIYCYESEGGVSDVTIEDCDLFGCGVEGIQAGGDIDIRMRDSVIRDCSYDILSVWGKGTFENCTFSGNGYYYNEGPAIYGWEDPLTFTNCTFENNKNLTLLSEETTACQFDGCTFSGNGWEQ